MFRFQTLYDVSRLHPSFNVETRQKVYHHFNAHHEKKKESYFAVFYNWAFGNAQKNFFVKVIEEGGRRVVFCTSLYYVHKVFYMQ